MNFAQLNHKKINPADHKLRFNPYTAEWEFYSFIHGRDNDWFWGVITSNDADYFIRIGVKKIPYHKFNNATQELEINNG